MLGFESQVLQYFSNLNMVKHDGLSLVRTKFDGIELSGYRMVFKMETCVLARLENSMSVFSGYGTIFEREMYVHAQDSKKFDEQAHSLMSVG